MPTIQVEAHLSRGDLLKAAEQLAPEEFQQLVTELWSLRALRQAPRLGAVESTLLLRINQGLPEDQLGRYRELIDRRRQETLTPEEHAELLQWTDESERCETERMSALNELAQLRRTTLTQLMQTLGIPAPNHE